MHSKHRLINRAAVREKALATLARDRAHLVEKFTRVSDDFFTAIEAEVVIAIEKRIQFMPSCGKTLR